jgi:hypothetical protein
MFTKSCNPGVSESSSYLWDIEELTFLIKVIYSLDLHRVWHQQIILHTI